MVLEAYMSNDIKDVTLVPISISYDRLMEDYLFAKEVIGIPKPKESTTVSNFSLQHPSPKMVPL